jgi:hypothetical protein
MKCASFVFDDGTTRRTWGVLSRRPRNTHSSRYFVFGRTKK